MLKKYNCPDCGTELETLISCGAEGYHCPKCKVSKSRKRLKGHPHYIEPESKDEKDSEKKEG